jgi:hypothetical protein
MRRQQLTKARWLMVATLGAFAALVPTASADTAYPVWTCRASAAYVELSPLLNTQRIEPVLANGFPDRVASDTEQCATQDAGVQNIELPPNSGAEALLALEAASASTSIAPAIVPAREQVATADAGVAQTVHVGIPGLTVDAEVVTSTAEGRCVGETPQLTGSSKVAKLTINGNTVLDLPGTTLPMELTDINLAPLIRIRINRTINATTAANGSTPAGAELTQRAVEIELLAVPGGEPVSRIVLAETKADYHGAVCAPPVPPPTCPAGSVQTGTNPLVCSVTVIQCAPGSAPNPAAPGTCVLTCPAGSTAGSNGACVITQVVGPPPCPAGTTADPNAAGACIRPATPPACPAGTTRDPATQACILLVQRPCPAGSTPDPATRVCVLQVVRTTGSSGENGRIGSSTGPRATCGRLEMHFVRGRATNAGRSFTSRYGNRTVTRGRLVTCGANPRSIVGARIDVVHILPNGQRRRKTGLRSRAAGRLTLILPNDLRTRRIEYAYRPNLNTTRVTSRVLLRLTVRDRQGRVVR